MSKRRKKVKKKNRKIVWIIESLLFIILISLLVLLKIFNPQEREKIEEKSEETVKPLVIQTQQRKLDLDQLHSSAGIVISLDDSKVIFQFQQDEKIFPASLTKIATYIQMETALKQYGTGKRIMTIKKDEINVLVPESGKKIIVSFIEIMEIGTIKEYCWIRVINQLIFIRKENFVIGDIEDFKRFIKLNTLAGEDWSRVWKGRN